MHAKSCVKYKPHDPSASRQAVTQRNTSHFVFRRLQQSKVELKKIKKLKKLGSSRLAEMTWCNRVNVEQNLDVFFFFPTLCEVHAIKICGCSESNSKLIFLIKWPLRVYVRYRPFEDHGYHIRAEFFYWSYLVHCVTWKAQRSHAKFVRRTWWNLPAVKGKRRRLHSFRQLGEKFSGQQVPSCLSAHSWHKDEETRGGQENAETLTT